MQVDMDDARIVGQPTADGVHGDHVFGIIVAYALQVAKFAGYRFVRAQQVDGLYIEPLLAACGYEVNFSVAEYAYSHLEPLGDEVVVDDVFHHFLDTAAQVESAEQVAQAMVGKVVFVVLLEDALAVDVIPLMSYRCTGVMMKAPQRWRR